MTTFLKLLLVTFVFNLNNALFALNSSTNDQSFKKIQKLGTLKVCSQAGFIPFEMKDNKGNWNGFDVDIMTAFAKQNSLKLQMIDSSLEGLIPALMTGKCDFLASGLTATEERKKAVLFSKPVYTVTISAALLDTPENRKKYKNFSDLDVKGTKIASHTGSAATLYLKGFIKNAALFQYAHESDEISAVLQKKTDAFVEDNVFIEQAEKEMKIKFFTIYSKETGDLAMASRKSDIQLMEKFNSFLDQIQKNGQYDLIRKKYFN